MTMIHERLTGQMGVIEMTYNVSRKASYGHAKDVGRYLVWTKDGFYIGKLVVWGDDTVRFFGKKNIEGQLQDFCTDYGTIAEFKEKNDLREIHLSMV